MLFGRLAVSIVTLAIVAFAFTYSFPGLIVAGLAMWPMMGKVDSAALPICLITLPIAGVGCFVGKTITGFALGLVVGVLFHLNNAIS